MLAAAVLASGGALVLGEVAAAERWHDLGAFVRCVERLAATSAG